LQNYTCSFDIKIIGNIVNMHLFYVTYKTSIIVKLSHIYIDVHLNIVAFKQIML